MAYRKRLFFTEKQKAEIWDRWQRGETVSSIRRLFDRASSSIYPLLERTRGTMQSNNYRLLTGLDMRSVYQTKRPDALVSARPSIRKETETLEEVV